jgi:cyclopropane fatty-acyl-phospholipid synthase-like methyltransferase
VEFSLNILHPPLPYEDNFFDIITGISVFTHLSEALHHTWFKELTRICSRNGILYLTTQGNAFRSKLTRKETRLFDEGNIVVRGMVKQGHRTFSAFQPEDFMIRLFEGFKILEHVEHASEGQYIPQDIWIIRKL